jgi:hypothetical protein
MKKPLSMLAMGVIGLVGASGSELFGQAPQSLQPVGQPSIQPAVSPYIGLLRPGANPAINYFNDVLPQLGYNAQLPYLQNQIGANQQAINQVQYGIGYLETGHTTRFMNYGGYFNNLNGGVGNRSATFAPGYRTIANQGLPGQGFNGPAAGYGAYGGGYGGGAYGTGAGYAPGYGAGYPGGYGR